MVRGARDVEFDLICTAAHDAAGFMEARGLAFPAALQVQVHTGELKIGGLDVFGCFDAQSGVIRLLDFEGCTKAGLRHKPYRRLPPKALYRSIVVHEVAHRVFRENLGRRSLGRTAHEYVAYAVQISLMPEDVRKRFLAALRRSPPTDFSRFSEMLLLMAPATFGAMAYDHFTALEAERNVLGDIVKGRVRFPKAVDLE